MRISQSLSGASESGVNRAWAVSLGVWGGTPVRCHLSVAFVGLAILYAATSSRPIESSRSLQLAVIAFGTYLFALIAHVAGHIATARRVGMAMGPLTIVLWGEREILPVSRDPEQSMWIASAGVLTNLVLALLAAAVLPLFPDFRPEDFATLPERSTLGAGALPLVGFKLFLVSNLVVGAVNLLIVPPFDGAQAVVRMVEWIDPDVDPDRWKTLLSLMGWGAGAGLVAIAPFLHGRGQDWVCEPMWLIASLGLVQLFAPSFPLEPRATPTRAEPALSEAVARLSRLAVTRDDDRIDVDFTPRAPALSSEEQAQADENRVDGILAKLHERGMTALSAEEQDVLRRVSQRYQKRRAH